MVKIVFIPIFIFVEENIDHLEGAIELLFYGIDILLIDNMSVPGHRIATNIGAFVCEKI